MKAPRKTETIEDQIVTAVCHRFLSPGVGVGAPIREARGWRVELQYRVHMLSGGCRAVGVVRADDAGNIVSGPDWGALRQAIDDFVAEAAPRDAEDRVLCRIADRLSLAEQRLDFDLVLEDFRDIKRRLRNFFHGAEKARRLLHMVTQTIAALEELRARLIRFTEAEEDLVRQLSILTLITAAACPDGLYREVPLYRRWCTRTLEEIIKLALETMPSGENQAWALAYTALNRLVRLGLRDEWLPLNFGCFYPQDFRPRRIQF